MKLQPKNTSALLDKDPLYEILEDKQDMKKVCLTLFKFIQVQLKKEYKKMKKKMLTIKKSNIKFDGNNFSPMNMIKSNNEHLNH